MAAATATPSATVADSASALVHALHSMPRTPGTPETCSASVASSPTAIMPDADKHALGALYAGVHEDARGAASAAAKKNRKRKKKKSARAAPAPDAVAHDAALSELERKLGGADDAAAWRARADARLQRLCEEKELRAQLELDVRDAKLRADDAQHAERVVNMGLSKAHALLAERDKSIQSADTHAQKLSAEIAALTDQKRKADKRLLMLKTMSENLQEERAARAAGERKAELRARDAAHEALRTRREIELLTDALAEVRAAREHVAQQLDVTQGLLDNALAQRELLCAERDAAEARARDELRAERRRAHTTATVSAVGGLVAGFVLRGVVAQSDARRRVD